MPASDKAPLVHSLVYNPCTSDARVLKQAKILAHAGYNVKIFARSHPNTANTESIDGFEIHRFECYESNLDFEQHIEKIAALFGEDADIIFENCKLYSSLKQTSNSLEILDELISSAFSSGFLSSILNRFRTINRLKDSISRHSPYRVRVTKSAYQSVFLRAKRPLREAFGSNFFYANYYLYCVNLLAQSFEQRPDIIHAHDLYTLPAAVALKQLTGARLIYDAHELEAERAPPLPVAKKNFILRMEAKCLKEIDGMITVCHSIARVYEQKNILNEFPTVAMNAPDMRASPETSDSIDIRVRAKLPENAPIVVYTGGVSRENRGMDKVVQALALLPKFHLVIVGPSNINNDQWLLNVANEIDVTERVHFLSPVKHTEVVTAITSGDIGIIAIQDVTLSYRYALPNKLFEMTFAGLPLCVSDLPEMREFVEKNGNGVTMDQTDPEAIAKAIQTVFNNRSKFAPDKERLASIVEKYEWKKQASNIIDLYQNLLNK